MDTSKANLHKVGTTGHEDLAQSLGRRRIAGIAKRCSEENPAPAHPCERRCNAWSHGTECSRCRIFGIDDVGTSTQGCRSFLFIRHADEQTHGVTLYPLHPMTQPLNGQTVLVTGASSGIGQAIALAVAAAGADVALTFRANEAGARAVERQIAAMGRRVHVAAMDLSAAASVREACADVVNWAGRVDAWINNAGADILTGQAASLSQTEKLDLLLQVDLRGTMLASWAAAEILGRQATGGVIINMSWDHVISGMAGANPQMFAAVKGGVMAFSKSLARTVAPRIRVNVLAPGWIQTSFGDSLDQQRQDAVATTVPLQRWGTPEDVAAAAVYLVSPGAAYLTGQTIFIGGGAVM